MQTVECVKSSAEIMLRSRCYKHEIPKRPFEVLASDLLDYGGQSYLVLLDLYSNWIELHKFKSKSMQDILQRLKILCFWAITKKNCQTNVPCNSNIFRQFCKDYDIEIIFSSPRYPISNGLAEKAVGIIYVNKCCRNVKMRMNNCSIVY